jgi:hypothetical protein
VLRCTEKSTGGVAYRAEPLWAVGQVFFFFFLDSIIVYCRYFR